MLPIRIAPDIEKRLQELANKTGRSKTYYASEAMTSFLDDIEDKYLALKRLENPQGTFTQEELEADIDLKDDIIEKS